MKLSIIIPTLNEEKYLPQTLLEIKKQQFSDYEIIVADSGSTDKTVEIARRFGCKITKGGLPAKGRNEGAKISQGDLLLFMDSDNVYLSPDFLTTAINEFRKRNLGIASFPVLVKGNSVDRLIYLGYNIFVKAVQKIIPLAFNTILVRKDVHFQIGGFDEKIRIAEDYDYAQRAAKISPFGFINTEPILTSARRIERDGRIKVYLKYLLIAIMLPFGPIKSDIISYRFGYYHNKEKHYEQ